MYHLANRLSARLPLALIALTVALSGCVSPPQEREQQIELVFPDPPAQPRFYLERALTGSADVEKESEDDKMARFLAGVGRASRGMAKPFDVAVHQGRVFVSDTGANTVHIFDKAKAFYKSVDEINETPMGKLFGIDVDATGTLYAVDSTFKLVRIFTRDGKHLKNIGDKELFSRPSGIAVTPAGDKVFVVDTGGVDSSMHQIQVLDTATGELIKTIGSRGKDEGYFNLPKDATIAKDGLLYVVDSGNWRVTAHTLDGEYVKKFGAIGRVMGSFMRPKGISSDNDGNIYIIDAAFGNFQIFDTEGNLLLFVGKRSQQNIPAGYMLPAGIDIDEDGRVLVVDQYHRRVDIYRPAALKKDEGYLGVFARDPKVAKK